MADNNYGYTPAAPVAVPGGNNGYTPPGGAQFGGQTPAPANNFSANNSNSPPNYQLPAGYKMNTMSAVKDPVKSGVLLGIGVAAFIGAMLCALNFGILTFDEIDETFEIRAAFIPLATLLALMTPSCLAACVSGIIKPDGLRHIFQSCSGILVVLLSIGLMGSLAVPVGKARPWAQATQLTNVEDADVEEVITFSLALFNTCCFDPANATDIPPPLSCADKNFTQPCFSNATLFDDFNNLIDFDSELCSATLFSESNSTKKKKRRRRLQTTQAPGSKDQILNGDFLCNQGETVYVDKVTIYVAGLLFLNIGLASCCGGCFCLCGSGVIATAIIAPTTVANDPIDEEEKSNVNTYPAYGNRELEASPVTASAQPQNEPLVVIAAEKVE